MSNRIMKNKALYGLIAVLITGISCAEASPDEKNGTDLHDEMALVPAGKFLFGKNKKEVNLPAFMIDKYEVTNKQYAKFNLDHKYEPQLANFPVTMVTLEDAKFHCEAMDKRLPTEQEWEKAARGTDGRLFPWGDTFETENAITSETDFEGHPPQPLKGGSRPKGKSPYGAMDMAGNLWEWTASYDGRYSILKGGSYFDDQDYAMTTSRLRSIQEDTKDYFGFRCAKDVK